MKKKKRKLVLRIDKNNLDVECEKFADDYGYWAGKLASAKNEVALAESELKLTEAELKLAIRSNHGKYGFASRPSDDAVGAKVLTLEPYQQALRALHAAKYARDQYEVGVKGLDHKRPLIEQSCFLHSQAYFARVKTAEVPRPKMMKRGRTREPE